MVFNWDKFMDRKNKIAVHCKTEKEADTFLLCAREHGIKWNNDWSIYGGETCYCSSQFYYGIGVSERDYFESRGYKILEWEDYMDIESHITTNYDDLATYAKENELLKKELKKLAKEKNKLYNNMKSKDRRISSLEKTVSNLTGQAETFKHCLCALLSVGDSHES